MSALSPVLNPSALVVFPRRAPLSAVFPFTAPIGTETLVPTAAGALTVNAPGAGASSRFDGAMFCVTDVDGSAAANPITISGNGKTIDGAASVSLATAFGSAVFVFDTFDDQWHRLLFPRAITDPIKTNILFVDLANGVTPLVHVSTLYGDGTAASLNSPQNNPSHVLGDVISWEPAGALIGGVQQWKCLEVSVNGISVNNAPTILTLLPIGNLESYAIDITMTAKRHDGTGVTERWKLSGVVSRDDAHGGVQYDANQTETDGISTVAGQATVLGLLLDTTANVLSVIFGAIAGGGNTAEYAGAIRLARQVTTS